MTINLDTLAASLNEHSFQFSPEIATKSRQGLEFETMLTQRQSAGEYYVVENAEASEILQPYQGTFTPKGTLTHGEQNIRVRPIKLDLEFTEVQLEKWWNSWQVSRFDVHKDPEAWTFPRYIFEKELLPKFQDNLNTLAWNGVYNAPTAGTAGDANDAVDGFKTIIAAHATANTIGEVATGDITASNARDKVEEFLDGIPEVLTAKGGRILMSPQVKRYYMRDYRGEFTQITATINGNISAAPVYVDGYNVTLEAVASMAGSERLIFLPNGRDNMVWVSRQGAPVYPEVIFKSQARVLQMYATIYRGFGFEYPAEVYVNDQV